MPASRGLLAIVVSKADLLRTAGLAVPAGSQEIAQWLWDLGLHNLVMSARRDFAEVRFFCVASQDIPPGSAGDPGAPLRWLLLAHGSRLPADPADTPDGAGPARPPARSRPGDRRARTAPAEHAKAPS